MIKIKDNVELEELKKFGFYYEEEEYSTYRALYGRGEEMAKYANEKYKSTYYVFSYNLHNLIVQDTYINRQPEDVSVFALKEREINIAIDEDYIERPILDKLYELIQAGLVEKVANEED